MVSLEAFVRQWPRVAAAGSFGIAGMVLPAAWFLPSVLSRRDSLAFLLYIAVPSVSAALAGAMAGASLCDPAQTISPVLAMVRGVAVATLALVIFAPTFGAIFAWTAPGRTNVLGLTVMVLIFCGLAVWWCAAAVGGLVGWSLHKIASHRPAD